MAFRITSKLTLVVWLFALVVSAMAQKSDDIDWNKARELHQQLLRGEKLSPDEQAYHDRAAQAMHQGRANDRQTREGQRAAGQIPPRIKPPPGLKPLTDMTADDRYQGEDGGLYGRGSNQPPPALMKAALEQARRIRPLDADGKPAAKGKIGFISIGMSNTTQEFSIFMQLANRDPAKSPQVVIVDGAQGGMDAKAWAVTNRGSETGVASPWEELDKRLRQSRLSANQVQAAWLKEALIGPGKIGEFPLHARQLKSYMATIVEGLARRFPNLRIIYLSSRIYAGYARKTLNPEPYAYESAFAVRWLIQDQLKGGALKPPILLWGPYLWADGTNGRKIDNLVWTPEDMSAEGTHPGDGGRRKVADLLLAFMKTDPTARMWFAGDGR